MKGYNAKATGELKLSAIQDPPRLLAGTNTGTPGTSRRTAEHKSSHFSRCSHQVQGGGKTTIGIR